jgi:rod shape-determining protein MreD
VRNVALIALGFGLLLVQSVAATILSVHSVAPNLLLPVVIFLGVSHDVHIVRGAALSFVLGYLFDSFTGSPMGLMTFVLVATFIVARFAGLRFFLRGPIFQIILTFLVGLFAGGTVLALRAIFEKPAPFPAGTWQDMSLVVVVPALTTAIVSPLVFAMVRRIESVATRRREERTAAS